MAIDATLQRRSNHDGSVLFSGRSLFLSLIVLNIIIY